MLAVSRVILFALSALGLMASGQAWKDKQFSEWSEEDAKAVIANSPWVKIVTPTVAETSKPEKPRKADGGSRGGILGIVERHGWSSHSGASQSGRPESSTSVPPMVPVLTVRWESAAPVREAELGAHETNAPAVDEDHYAIAVYGLPRSTVANESRELAEELKKHATLKRLAKSDVVPSRVEILIREDGPVIVYLFPKSAEITWRDTKVEFDAQVAQFTLSVWFEIGEMKFHGDLEL